MKKYMKPIMESEAFLSNEYVAACWYMNCACTDTGVIVGGANYTQNDLNKVKGDLGVYELDNTYIYVGTMGGKKSCKDASTDNHTTTDSMDSINQFVDWWNSKPILGWFFPLDRLESELKDHHHVTFELKGTSNGPNAS